MSRRARQRAILEIVSERVIRNQAELVTALEKVGLAATQATVSRDIRQLGLVKLPANGGPSRYTPPGDNNIPEPASEALGYVADFITGVRRGSALLVVGTEVGHANAVAAEIDKCRFPEVVGTLAGDDTILLILRKEKDRAVLEKRLRELIA